jgi:hypothetical protein
MEFISAVIELQICFQRPNPRGVQRSARLPLRMCKFSAPDRFFCAWSFLRNLRRIVLELLGMYIAMCSVGRVSQ